MIFRIDLLSFVLLFLSIAQAIQIEEVYKYQGGLMITQLDEDFILDKYSFNPRNQDQEKLQISDKFGLFRQADHSMDELIDVKQNQFGYSDYIWILYRKENQTIFSKHQIDWTNQENYYLQLSYQCYSFYFVSQFQIVIDCQNLISNILILFDIEHNLQQSFFHSQYKESKLRNLLKVEPSNLFIFIQQEQFLKICYNSNKYQVCDQLIYKHDAHTVYIYLSEIVLISKYWIDIFFIGVNHKFAYIKREDLSKIPIETEYPILFYFYNYLSYIYYVVKFDNIFICKEDCYTFKLDSAPLRARQQENYLIVQTQQNIVILCMVEEQISISNVMFNNQLVTINRKLQEFYLVNDIELRFYGLTQFTYYRVINQSTIIVNGIKQGEYYKKSSLQKKIYVLFDNNFKFKSFTVSEQYTNNFFLTGGLLDINIQVEDQYQQSIRLNFSHFIKIEFREISYFWFNIQHYQKKESIIIFVDQTILYKKFDYAERYQCEIKEISFLKLISSFNQGYLIQDIRDGFKYIMQINDKLKINLIQFDCRYNLTVLTCYYKYCICLNDTHIRIQEIGLRVESTIFYKQQKDRVIHLDKDNRILYLINDNNLNIKYYNLDLKEIHNNLISICSTFINLVILKLKMIIICTDQMILYNKISNYRYIYSGNIELYDQQFVKSSQVINSDDYLFYIISNGILHVFNSNLPLSQMYVTQMKLDKFDTVKSYKNDICFQYKNNLQCYQYQINIKLIYDDNVEYHQGFKVNVCGGNKYDRICKEFITRLDQQNRKISIKSQKAQLIINKNTKEIQLDNRYFSGSINNIQTNKYQIKSKVQLVDHTQIILTQRRNFYYGGKDNFIIIRNNQSLSVYDIKTKLIKNLTTSRPMKFVLPYKSDYVLIGFSYISVINCDSNCKEVITLDCKLALYGVQYIHNNTLYTSNQTSLITYNLDNLNKNGSLQPIYEQLYVNLIDISQDNYGNMCMVYIDRQNELVFKHLEKIIKYNILISLRHLGVDLNHLSQDIIFTMKLLDDCKLLYIGANFGIYFVELSQELNFLAQIVVKKSHNIHLNQFLYGQRYLFYIQQFPLYISIYKFTYHQIYNSKYVDQSSMISKQNRQYSFKDYYFQVYNDELYLAQADYQKLFVFIINPEIFIQLEQVITNKEEIKITLFNSEENKSFILELVMEENFFQQVWIIMVILLLLCYIWLIYQRVTQKH